MSEPKRSLGNCKYVVQVVGDQEYLCNRDIFAGYPSDQLCPFHQMAEVCLDYDPNQCDSNAHNWKTIPSCHNWEGLHTCLLPLHHDGDHICGEHDHTWQKSQ